MLIKLFDEQWHASGALKISSTISRERPALPASPSTSTALSLAPAQLIQRQHRHLRLDAPGVPKLGAEGDDQQDRQQPYAIECKVEQFPRGRIYPMRVLEYHQDRPALSQGFELVQLSLKQHFAVCAAS